MCTLNILIHILLISGSFAPGTSFVNAIHAPANGATEDQHQATEVHPISINALTNGATAIKNLQMTLSTNFNPRSSERSDQRIRSSMRLLIFQSTLRRTERHTAIATCLIVLNFNPRSGERSDWKARQDGRDCAISIHAPANGATGVVGAGASAFKFQSTLRRTERHHQHSIASDSIKFQSTLRRTERHHRKTIA